MYICIYICVCMYTHNFLVIIKNTRVNALSQPPFAGFLTHHIPPPLPFLRGRPRLPFVRPRKCATGRGSARRAGAVAILFFFSRKFFRSRKFLTLTLTVLPNSKPRPHTNTAALLLPNARPPFPYQPPTRPRTNSAGFSSSLFYIYFSYCSHEAHTHSMLNPSPCTNIDISLTLALAIFPHTSPNPNPCSDRTLTLPGHRQASRRRSCFPCWKSRLWKNAIFSGTAYITTPTASLPSSAPLL